MQTSCYSSKLTEFHRISGENWEMSPSAADPLLNAIHSCHFCRNSAIVCRFFEAHAIKTTVSTLVAVSSLWLNALLCTSGEDVGRRDIEKAKHDASQPDLFSSHRGGRKARIDVRDVATSVAADAGCSACAVCTMPQIANKCRDN